MIAEDLSPMFMTALIRALIRHQQVKAFSLMLSD